MVSQIDEVGERCDSALVLQLNRIEEKLDLLLQQRTVKDWYTTAEVAQVLGKAEFTVREWCRQGRIHAAKRACGRGKAKEWAISHAELERIRNEGLLPF
jgi:helix-turn-helix protein